MTIDEAIKKAEEIAEEKFNNAVYIMDKMKSDVALKNAEECKRFSEEHRQLAEWLKDYKRLKEQEPCDDAISRQAVIDEAFEVDTKEYGRIEVVGVDAIEALPPVNPQPKIGHWIEHPEIETSVPEYLMFYECSECGGKLCFCKPDIHKKRFCNYCGCRMVEPQESEKISERNMKMWEEIFKAESEDKE